MAFFRFLSLTVHKSFTHASVKKAFTIGSLSNDDGDGNENCKKAIGLDWQNNKFACASRFLVHFLAVVARLQRESA